MRHYVLFLIVLLCSFMSVLAQSNNTLWYNQPAEFFEQALVLGNGRVGATVFGGVQSDQIYLNDATLWSGGPVDPDNGRRINYGGGGGTYPNFFDAHPPFQIDGNFGGAAGVIEMLLQSDDEGVYLLPALPDAWQSGSISGICARGGFELSMKWNGGTLTSVDVLSKAGKDCSLYYKDKTVKIETKKGNTYSFDAVLKLKQ